MSNVIRHPAFEHDPVINERRRGRPPGTASIATQRRRRDSRARAQNPVQTRVTNSVERSETDAQRANRLQYAINEIAHHLHLAVVASQDLQVRTELGRQLYSITRVVVDCREANHG
jgi:hypothetical protein